MQRPDRQPVGCAHNHMRLLVLTLAMLSAEGSVVVGDDGLERVGCLTGRSLAQELSRPVNIVLQRTTPREVVRRLRDLHRIALLLDRRIDPDRSIDVQFTQVSLQEALEIFAVQLDADVVQIGGTLFIGPPQSTDRIRTLIELRTAELRELEGEDAVGRQFTLLRGTTINWERLSEPAQLVADVCTAYEIEQLGEAHVPHDLWAEGTLADVNAIEAVSLLLGQFDLTFAWEQQSAAIRLQPSPQAVNVSRAITPRRLDVAEAVALIREQFPHLDPQVSGRSISLAASVGEHEAIAELLDPQGGMQSPRPPSLGPLSRRRFTLKATRAEAIAILRTLEAQGVNVEYDLEQLRKAQIDLREMVSLELNEASADELFRQLCEPLNLSYEIEDTTVRLKPAPQ